MRYEGYSLRYYLGIGALISIGLLVYAAAYPLLMFPDYALAPAEAIRLQAALDPPVAAMTEPATLSERLRTIEIRTALEDTSRIRYELG